MELLSESWSEFVLEFQSKLLRKSQKELRGYLLKLL